PRSLLCLSLFLPSLPDSKRRKICQGRSSGRRSRHPSFGSSYSADSSGKTHTPLSIPNGVSSPRSHSSGHGKNQRAPFVEWPFCLGARKAPRLLEPPEKPPLLEPLCPRSGRGGNRNYAQR